MKYLVILVLCLVGALAHCDKAPFVKTAWESVKHNEVDILYAVFKEYPEIQARFPQFVGKDLDNIRGSAAFATHAVRIINLLTEVISLLGNSSNIPAINNILNDLANNHKSRGITKDLFVKFNAAFINYMRAHATWNNEIEAAWNAVSEENEKIVYAIVA